jgi:hypothetical protein
VDMPDPESQKHAHRERASHTCECDRGRKRFDVIQHDVFIAR